MTCSAAALATCGRVAFRSAGHRDCVLWDFAGLAVLRCTAVAVDADAEVGRGAVALRQRVSGLDAEGDTLGSWVGDCGALLTFNVRNVCPNRSFVN